MATGTEIGGLLVRVPPARAASARERTGLASSRSLVRGISMPRRRFRPLTYQRRATAVRSVIISERMETADLESSNGPISTVSCFEGSIVFRFIYLFIFFFWFNYNF